MSDTMKFLEYLILAFFLLVVLTVATCAGTSLKELGHKQGICKQTCLYDGYPEYDLKGDNRKECWCYNATRTYGQLTNTDIQPGLREVTMPHYKVTLARYTDLEMSALVNADSPYAAVKWACEDVFSEPEMCAALYEDSEAYVLDVESDKTWLVRVRVYWQDLKVPIYWDSEPIVKEVK